MSLLKAHNSIRFPSESELVFVLAGAGVGTSGVALVRSIKNGLFVLELAPVRFVVTTPVFCAASLPYSVCPNLYHEPGSARLTWHDRTSKRRT